MWGGEQVKLPACSARVSAIRNLPRRIFVVDDDDVVVVDDDVVVGIVVDDDVVVVDDVVVDFDVAADPELDQRIRHAII